MLCYSTAHGLQGGPSQAGLQSGLQSELHGDQSDLHGDLQVSLAAAAAAAAALRVAVPEPDRERWRAYLVRGEVRDDMEEEEALDPTLRGQWRARKRNGTPHAM